MNGDGYTDVIVGAHLLTTNGQMDEGRAYVYLGGASGLCHDAAWTAESDPGERLLRHLGGDGGGRERRRVHRRHRRGSRYDNGQTDEGRAFVYLGSASGLAVESRPGRPRATRRAPVRLFGGDGGDVNGDGYGDVIVGAFNYSNGQTDEGRAYVYLGRPRAWRRRRLDGRERPGRARTSAFGGDGGGRERRRLQRRHRRGDDYDNGQTDEGRAYVYLGGAAGLSAGAAWTAESDQAGA